MVSFFACLIFLLLGYVFYGKMVEKRFAPDQRLTPALADTDGVDFVAMPTWRIFLIQLLNIAGLGPIFGAVSGALWGPVVFLWITLGTVFAGGVHDFFSGMLSLRSKGGSVGELVGAYLGNGAKLVMRLFSVVLLVLVGTVFTTGPAGLLALLTPDRFSVSFWVMVILAYYFLATMIPIDKLIGKVYPFFGVCLLFMAVGILGGLLFHGYNIPEITLKNLHPSGLSPWPFMFITVACGAISGFHATQSPLMARCLGSEAEGRVVFYGAMVAEGIIALIWAAAGVIFYETTGGLQAALLSLNGQSGVVYDICKGLLGPFGAVLAMIGVIACPISSGDTAFRSARLVLADWLNLRQKRLFPRLLLAIPLLALGFYLCGKDVSTIWRYFSWSNQTLAMIMLWTAAVYLLKEKKAPWLPAIPAAFMSAVTATYIFTAEEGLGLPLPLSTALGLAFTLLCIILFLRTLVKERQSLT